MVLGLAQAFEPTMYLALINRFQQRPVPGIQSLRMRAGVAEGACRAV